MRCQWHIHARAAMRWTTLVSDDFLLQLPRALLDETRPSESSPPSCLCDFSTNQPSRPRCLAEGELDRCAFDRRCCAVPSAPLTWIFPRRSMQAPVPHDSYASLRSPEYRAFLGTMAVVFVGTQVQSAVLGWQVYALTHDPLSLGLVGLSEAQPFLALVNRSETHCPPRYRGTPRPRAQRLSNRVPSTAG